MKSSILSIILFLTINNIPDPQTKFGQISIYFIFIYYIIYLYNYIYLYNFIFIFILLFENDRLNIGICQSLACVHFL